MSRVSSALLAPLLALLALLLATPLRVDAQAPLVHVVRPGETLASIAELYYGDPHREGVLVTENGLNSGGGSAIVVGMRLLIPSVSYHKVLEGETWAELATRFYGDPSRAFVLIESNGGKSAHPDVGAELLIPYPLRHIADQNEALRKIAKTYFKSQSGINTISRFNEAPKTRVVRGQILLVPLADLVLTKEGKELADKQRSEQVGGGDVRQKQASIDAELPALREHVRAGRYADALSMANRLIGAGDLTSSHVVSIHREMATALVALDREDLAKEALVRMLQEQPDAELDGVRTSPRVLKVFEQAKQLLASKAAQDDGKSGGHRSGSRSSRSGAKSESRSEGKSESRSEGKSESRSEGKSESRTEGKPEGRLEGKSEGKSEGRSEGKSEGRSEGKSEGRSEGKSEAKSDDKPKDDEAEAKSARRKPAGRDE